MVVTILPPRDPAVVRVLLWKIPSHAFSGENGGQSGSSRSKEDGTMLAHRLRMIAFAAIAMGLATVASTQANVETSRTQYLTFTRPVALPGVTPRAELEPENARGGTAYAGTASNVLRPPRRPADA